MTAVFSAPFLGGSELFNLEFLTEARREGTRVTAIAPGEGTLADALRACVDEVIVLPIPAALADLSRFGRPSLRDQLRGAAALARYAWQLRRLLRRTRGAICAMGFRAQLGVAATRGTRGRRVAWVVHEVVPTGRFGRLWGRASRRVDLVVSYSETATTQPLLRGAPVRLAEIRLDLAPYLAVDLPTPPVTRIGLVGDLFELKNHLGFLDVLDQVREAGHDVHGTLVGRDTSASNPTAEYVAAVKEAVASRAAFAELTEAPPAGMAAVFASFDVLLHLSTVPESFGRVVVEAMAAGRPVVAFRLGAVQELVENGRTGVLVDPNDLGAVTGAVVALVGDAERFRALSVGARLRARERWDASTPGDTIGHALSDFARGTS